MKLQILIISLLHVISINHSLCQTLSNKKIEKIKTEAKTIVEAPPLSPYCWDTPPAPTVTAWVAALTD